MASLAERTFVLNFRSVPGKLKYSDVFEFIVNKLCFDLSRIKHLQVSNGQVFVGTDSAQIAQDMVQEHNMKHEFAHDGKVYNIPLSMEDGTIEVRVHDLRPRITNRMLAQRMREYGEILSIREETWKDHLPGVPNGVRALRMKLVKPIPSYVQVDTELTLVTYRGQVATCKHCNRNVHYTQKCSDYAKTIKKSVNTRMTMAEILKKTGPSAPTSTFAPLVPTGTSALAVPSAVTDQSASTSSFTLPGPSGAADPSQAFVDPRKKKKPHTSSLSETRKTHPLNRSNISLADSEISVSSAEQMTIDFPTLEETIDPSKASDPVAAAGSSTGTLVVESSPPFLGFSGRTIDHEKQQHSSQPSNETNVKRPGSPLCADSKSADKRQARTQIHTETRSSSRNRNH